jgi:hypothetical protein
MQGWQRRLGVPGTGGAEMEPMHSLNIKALLFAVVFHSRDWEMFLDIHSGQKVTTGYERGHQRTANYANCTKHSTKCH